MAISSDAKAQRIHHRMDTTGIVPWKLSPFPRRMPEKRITGIYPSVEEAFRKRDYMYVARYGKDAPELRGCALIMLGNRTGGERVLDQNRINSQQSCLYRAFGAWRAEQEAEARRWISEGRAQAGAHPLPEFDRLTALMDKKTFRVLMHTRGMVFDHVRAFQDIPGVELLLISHAPPDGVELLQIGASLGTMVPQDKPIDMAIIYDPWIMPPGAQALAVPTILIMNDTEQSFDALCEAIYDFDYVAVQSTSEMIECGEAFDAPCFTHHHFFPCQMDVTSINKRLIDTSDRPLDLVFTGGAVADFYRNKRQQVLPLGHAVDPRFNLFICQGMLPRDEYLQKLYNARFAPVCVRFGNYVTSRYLDLLACGVICLVDEGCNAPYFFSKDYACFQTYSDEDPIGDMERHLFRYEEIIEELSKDIYDLEAELADLIISNDVRARNSLRDFQFLTFVLDPKSSLPEPKPSARSVTVPCNAPIQLAEHPRQLDRLLDILRPNDSGEAANWLRSALGEAAKPEAEPEHYFSIVEKGLFHHSNSLPLHYARALLLRGMGRMAEAAEAFRQIIHSDMVIADNDPFPTPWEKLHGFFWVMDARIRAKSPDRLEPFVAEKSVWISFAYSHLANLALLDLQPEKGNAASVEEKLREALAYAREALNHLPPNDAALRFYMRALYGLFNLGHTEYGDIFLETFEEAQNLDGRILNDFAPMAIDVLTRLQRQEAALNIREKLNLFLSRVFLPHVFFYLYPEVTPLLSQYDLPHGHLLRR